MTRFTLRALTAVCAAGFALAGCGASNAVLPGRTQPATKHRLSPTSESVLYSFQNNGVDGFSPSTVPYVDGTGALYGQTDGGGTGNDGAVYKLTPNGSGYAETILHSFTGGATDGITPLGEVTGDSSGAIYGTTSGGVDFGTVYKLTPSGSGYTESILYSFKDFPDGAAPIGGVILGKKGELFGTTSSGGSRSCYGGCGGVFKMVRHKKTYTESMIYTFQGQGAGDGQEPIASLVMDKKGTLYGTTEFGGTANQGTVFKLKPSKGAYKETVLHSFQGPSGSDGQDPEGRLILDASGNLYGTTNTGGTLSCSCGTVFKIRTNGKGYRLILSLSGGSSGNHTRAAALAFGANGTLYGTAYQGGANDVGLIFSLTPSGSGYSETVLYSFGYSNDGAGPYAGLVTDGLGHYFGTTDGGGSGYHPSGTVFEFTP